MTFEMVGHIGECFLLSYAVDPVRAALLVPPGLELATHRGSAFLNIVACRVDRIRPRLVPATLGITYWHIAYRLHVRARLAEGSAVEGLYFLRSDVDSALVGAAGNCLTDFKCHSASVCFRADREHWNLSVTEPRGTGSATLRARTAATSNRHALFESDDEQARFLKYAPFGLSTSGGGRYVRVAEVHRDEASWREAPLAIETGDWSYPRTVGLETNELLRATRVAPIDYTWRLGRTELLCYRSGRMSEGLSPSD